MTQTSAVPRSRVDYECQALPVWRQGALIIECRIIDEVLEPGPVRMDAIDIRLPGGLSSEDDPLPVSRIRWRVFQPVGRNQATRVRPVGVGDEHRHHRHLVPVEQPLAV